ncbi:hypothetical protein [Maricaulis salignorans]|uniref:hypothetical protein n=1 Tax=Maricaulis salignorans TaxID=144026 RepID=UPI003A8E7BC6
MMGRLAADWPGYRGPAAAPSGAAAPFQTGFTPDRQAGLPAARSGAGIVVSQAKAAVQTPGAPAGERPTARCAPGCL